jgi:hypothetical protein
VPLLPASLIEPLWVEFAALIGSALVHGSGYERIATTGCSDRTLRRRLRAWAQAGHGPTLHAQLCRPPRLRAGAAAVPAALPRPRRRAAACARRSHPADAVAVLLSDLLTGPDTVAVVSTDLSHYLDQDHARLRDARTVEAILARDPDALRPDDACGFHPMRGLLCHAADGCWSSSSYATPRPPTSTP